MKLKLLNNILKKNKVEKNSYLYDTLNLKKFINEYDDFVKLYTKGFNFRLKITNHRQQWVNSIFNYNSNNIINIAQYDKIINNLITSYFNLYNKEIEKNKAGVRFYKPKYRKKSAKKIFFNFSNAKHTNNLVTLNLFTYNRYNKSINNKLKKLDIFYKTRFKFNDTKLSKESKESKDFIKPKKYTVLKKHKKNNILKKNNLKNNLKYKLGKFNRYYKKDFIKNIKLNYKFIFKQQLKNKIKIYKYNDKILNKNFEYIKNTLTKDNINLYNPVNIKYINKKFSYLNLSKNKKYNKLQKKIKTIIIVRKSKNINNKFNDNIIEIKTLHTDSSKFDIKYSWNNNKLISNNKKLNKKKNKLKQKKTILNIKKKFLNLKKKYPGKNQLKKKYFLIEKENKLIKNKLTKKQRLKYISQNKIKKYELRKEKNKLKKYQLTTNNIYLKQYVNNYLDNKVYSKLNKDIISLKKEKKTKIKKFIKSIAKGKIKLLSMIEYSTLKKRVIIINRKKKRNFLKKYFSKIEFNNQEKHLKKFLLHKKKRNLRKKKNTIRKNLYNFLYKNKRNIKTGVKTTKIIFIKKQQPKRKFISFRQKTRLKNSKKYIRALFLTQQIKLKKNINILRTIKSPDVEWLFKALSRYVYSKKRRLIIHILSVYKKHVYQAWLKSLEKKFLIIYYKQMGQINKLKFQDLFLIKLKNIISKLYKKNVKFNIIDLKYPALDSNIFTQIICLKTAKQRKRLIRYILKRRALKKKKLRIKKLDVFLFKNKRKEKVQEKDLKLIYLEEMIKKIEIENIKPKNKDMLTFNINEYNNNNINKIEDIVFSSIKNKFIKGIRIEANGRLTRRLVASRSVYKHRQLGSFRNFYSSYSGLYGYLLRGHTDSYTQYTKLQSKTRNGSFGLKGWISTV